MVLSSKILRAAALTFIATLVACSTQSDIGAKVDAAVNDAAAKARAQLPLFWKVFESPSQDEKNFSIQVRIQDRNGSEPFWLEDIRHDNTKISGVIDSDPSIVKSVKRGDRIEISESDISDWAYTRDGKMVGNFLTRATLNLLSEKDAEHMRNSLADP
jgi:uncharacterized protein YegJ (DUF2314 family)